MEVAAQRGPDPLAALGDGRATGVEQPPQVDRDLAGEGLGDAARGHLPDALEFLQRASRGAGAQLVAVEGGHRRRSGPEGADPVGRLPGALQQVRDLAQVGDGVARAHGRPTYPRARLQDVERAEAVHADTRRAASGETIRRVEQAAGRLATLSVARMDDELPWFRALPADQRSWVMLVAQAGVQSFVEWLRTGDDVPRLTGDVFASAPRELARSVSLQRTVELVRQTISVVEEQLPSLASPSDQPALREEVLRFSREIAFAAARVYAGAAESRGSWDVRLEALVIDQLVSGAGAGVLGATAGEGPLSQVAALGWRVGGPVAAVVGTVTDRPEQEVFTDAHRIARRLGLDAMVGVHGGRLVLVLGGVGDPPAAAAAVLQLFGAGPVVVSDAVADLSEASAVTRAALAALRAAPGWPGAPRPVTPADLLPERALAGDPDAAAELVTEVYAPLAGADGAVLDTVATFLETGGSLEHTARTLFVHPNTVRYRLRRAAQLCGHAPTDPRGGFTVRLALVLGRLASAAGGVGGVGGIGGTG